jgi:6-phosphogluconolactonase (cycloisomerase 2 family)
MRYSRRFFIWGTAAAGLLRPLPSLGRRRGEQRTDGTIFAYAGTYSAQKDQSGDGGNGEGIHVFRIDSATGVLTQTAVYQDKYNPTCLAVNGAGTRLYATHETATFQGTASGSVSAFSIDRASGHLILLNAASSGGATPCHLSLHPSGRFVFVANYDGGSVAVLPIGPDGRLVPATDIQRYRSNPGPAVAHSSPPGSFAISGHEASHAHMIQSDHSGGFVLSTDLGTDRILLWSFDSRAGTLKANVPPSVSLPEGDGPRHFAFHPSGRWLYSLQEEGSTLAAFDYDHATGRLSLRQTLSSLPKGFAGTSFASEVLVSSDGRFLYAANRLHNSIAIFAIGAAGDLTYLGEQWTHGDYPASFNIDPTGRFLYVCNQKSDAITMFRVNSKTGALVFSGDYTPIGTPASIVFLA